MALTSWTDRHDDLVNATDPGPREASDAELDRIWNRVGGVVTTTPRPRRRRIRATLGAGLVALVVGASGIAVADHYGARTGEGPRTAEDLRLGGPGERLDPAAPDLAEVLRVETGDIPFPSATARERSLRIQVRENASASRPGTELVSTGALRGWVARDAVCAWANAWTVATRDGDAGARAEAAAMIRAARRWPALAVLADLDPEPFRYLGTVAAAAAGTDPKALGAALDTDGSFCWPALVPDLPQAGPWQPEPDAAAH